jgi:hypothetical protein
LLMRNCQHREEGCRSVQRRAFGPERHELLVSLHYTFKMLQTCAGEAAGRLPAPEAHSHHFKVLSEMYSCLPADVKCALVYPSFELRACRGGTRPRRQTAVLWGRRCVGRECDTWAATGPLSARVWMSSTSPLYFSFSRSCLGDVDRSTYDDGPSNCWSRCRDHIDRVRLCAPLIFHHFTAALTIAGHSISFRRPPCGWGCRLTPCSITA